MHLSSRATRERREKMRGMRRKRTRTLLRRVLSSWATGSRVNFITLWPSGRPRWEQSTTDLGVKEG